VYVARRFARDVLASHSAAVIGVAELLVSELITNAVLHARSTARLDIHLENRRIRVAVHDESTTIPQVRDAQTDDGGRGLLLVDALAACWGAAPTATGKYVWFEL
jgi:anti-sigma regulatory factor (Ser/Thr protein kinase)